MMLDAAKKHEESEFEKPYIKVNITRKYAFTYGGAV